MNIGDFKESKIIPSKNSSHDDFMSDWFTIIGMPFIEEKKKPLLFLISYAQPIFYNPKFIQQCQYYDIEFFEIPVDRLYSFDPLKSSC